MFFPALAGFQCHHGRIVCMSLTLNVTLNVTLKITAGGTRFEQDAGTPIDSSLRILGRREGVMNLKVRTSRETRSMTIKLWNH